MPVLTKLVSDNFSAHSHNYDRLALVQDMTACDVAYLAKDYLKLVKDKDIFRVIDVGAGTGMIYSKLVGKYGNVDQANLKLYACDISEGMLSVLQDKHPQVKVFQNDFNQLSEEFYACSYNLILSSFALQWSCEPAKVILDLKKALSPKGSLIIAIPVEGSLHELKTAFSARKNGIVSKNDTEKDFKLSLNQNNYGTNTTEFFNHFPREDHIVKDLLKGLSKEVPLFFENSAITISSDSNNFINSSKELFANLFVESFLDTTYNGFPKPYLKFKNSSLSVSFFHKDYCVYYTNLLDALHSITKIGAGTQTREKTSSLSRKILQNILHYYPTVASNDGIKQFPLTYKISFVIISYSDNV